MKIFITGASGYIGGSVAAHLVAAGHQVTGLVRSREKADAVRARGIEPLAGTLDDAEILAQAARAADVVINAASADHAGAVNALLGALAGSGKLFLHTSGMPNSPPKRTIGRSDAIFDESIPINPVPARAARVALNERILSTSEKGCRPVIICPSLIYGIGLGVGRDSVQVPFLIKLAKKRGNATHAGPGENIWSNVHIDDLVTLYALAIDKAPAGAFFFAEHGEKSHAGFCESALGDVDGRSRRRMGRGHRRIYDGVEQPGACSPCARTRLETASARFDRGDRTGLLPVTLPSASRILLRKRLYNALMMKVLEEAIEKVRKLPEERQAYAAEVLEQIAAAGGDDLFPIPQGHRAAVLQGLGEAERGEFVSDEEMAALWKKCGL